MDITFKDHTGREWTLPALTVESVADLKQKQGVDLWAVVQGKTAIDDDLGRLLVSFRILCGPCAKLHGFHTSQAILDVTAEVMSNGDNIAAFRHALERALTPFFPSAVRPSWEQQVENRSPTSITSLLSSSSADSSESNQDESPASSDS